MSTLTYSNDHLAAAGATTDAAAKPERKTFWRRLLEAMIAGQQRRADREIAVFLYGRGGMFNDDTEREMMQRISGRRRPSV